MKIVIKFQKSLNEILKSKNLKFVRIFMSFQNELSKQNCDMLKRAIDKKKK